MRTQQFTVKLFTKRNMLNARIVGGPKHGHTFSRPNVSEFDMEKFWNAMEHHFGGKCYR